MRRTPIGARKFVARSGIPLPAWARRVGISLSCFNVLMSGASRMQHGPAMERLIVLLDSWDRKEWEWERIGPCKLSKSWIWHGEPKIMPPPKPKLTINILEGRMAWQ